MTGANLDERPYRLNVGAVLFSRTGHVFLGRRAGLPNGAPASWQLPQGGIDEGEDARSAVLRELHEEIGTDRATILAEHPRWMTYELPAALAQAAFGGRYRGQRQKWFAIRFDGEDADIALDRDPHPEFVAWRWAPLSAIEAAAVPFKRAIYAALAQDFVQYATNLHATDLPRQQV